MAGLFVRVGSACQTQKMTFRETMLSAAGKSSGPTGTKLLLEAMSRDKVHLARFVLDALDGEIVDSQTEGAQTPLISSVLLPEDRTRCKFVELLLQKGASVNGQDGSGRTALSHACERGHLDAVKTLVRHNADPEVLDSWGNTALMYAAVEGHTPVVEFLVRAFKRLGLQIDRQNKAGNTAAEVAKVLGHTRCLSALTHNSKRNREAEGGAQEEEEREPRAIVGNELEKKVGHLVSKLELLQTCNCVQCLLVQNCTRPRRPRIKKTRVPSMDSIEELERENKSSSAPPPPDKVLSVFTQPAAATSRNHSPNTKYPKTGERVTAADDHLPPLLLSPPGLSSINKLLLTPISANKCDEELGTEKSKLLDFGERTFNESYYKKRCSLPASLFSPTPPERTLLAPLRKSRTVRRREASHSAAEPPHVTASPAAISAPSTFSLLSNKLLRRFTSPDRDQDKDPEFVRGRILRSETFPRAMNHPAVDSKASIDSISSVKCEFDCHFQKPNS